ncbi:MAG: hypothetical protein QM653_00620 [Dysgonomonas sp.]|uniref:hypothetical protein n=1 Tax=Dysgonomonas sp. TaxID=1891233 RepID=UPI0039E24282
MKIKSSFLMLLTASFFSACSDSENYEVTPPDPGGIKEIAVSFVDPNRNTSAKYEAVKIGEYLWFNSNINHYPASVETTRSQVDLVLSRYRLDPKQYKTSLSDINKYYGLYYNRADFEYLELNRRNYQIKENGKDAPTGAWGAPSNTDVAQLFAMCGNGTESDVRTMLTCKSGSNSAAIADYTYWFSNKNTNKYGFNLMPGGARFHANDKWTLKHNHNDNDIDVFDVAPGDFYGFVEAAIIVTWNGRVTIDDYIKFDNNKSWHLMTVRWCRQLTDDELGYKLYINQTQTDILKAGLKDAVPSGYTELPRGALRGFYVQFIINGVRPNTSVTEMLQLAKGLA